jgi:hypothetical protein
VCRHTTRVHFNLGNLIADREQCKNMANETWPVIFLFPSNKEHFEILGADYEMAELVFVKALEGYILQSALHYML